MSVIAPPDPADRRQVERSHRFAAGKSYRLFGGAVIDDAAGFNL